MPKTAAATTTAATAAGTTTNAGPTVTQILTVSVDLQFDGVNVSMAAFRSALDAAYGTVESLTDGAERPNGPWRFRIAP